MKIIILTFTLFYVQVAFAETPQKLSDQFFKHLEQGEADLAASSILSNNRDSQNKSALKMKLRKGLLDITAAQGTYYGYEELHKKRIGQSLEGRSFLLKYSRQPIRLTILFYKANKSWMMKDLNIDDDLDDEIADALRSESAQ